MAEVVVANREDTYMGNKKVIFADLSSVDNNDTFTTGLQKIDNVDFTKSTAAVGTDVGATVSGGVVTFKVESGSLAGKVMVVGT